MSDTNKRKKDDQSDTDTDSSEEIELPDPETVTDAFAVKLPKFTKKHNPHGVLCESSFSVHFPQYREVYIREYWPMVQETLQKHGVVAELDVREGKMTVKTSRKMWDPYIIFKARDLILLLSRSVKYEQAAQVLADDMTSEVIKIKSFVRNKARFDKRRARLVGPGGATLKALEMLTGCYIHVQGKTVSVIGTHNGLKQVRKVVVDTMKNIHPVYNIKAMIIKKQLQNDPNMKNEDWSRFIPKYVRVKKNKTKPKIKSKGEYTPFPPAAEPQKKIDRRLASGDYFLTEKEQRLKVKAAIESKRGGYHERRNQKLEELGTPPVEETFTGNDAEPGTSSGIMNPKKFTKIMKGASAKLKSKRGDIKL